MVLPLSRIVPVIDAARRGVGSVVFADWIAGRLSEMHPTDFEERMQTTWGGRTGDVGDHDNMDADADAAAAMKRPYNADVAGGAL